MNKLYILVVGLLLIQSSVFAQGWIKTYYDEYPEGVEFAYAQQTIDNGFIMAGRRGVTQQDILVIKTNQFGDTLWTYTLDLLGTQRAIDVEYVAADSSYAILYTGKAGIFDANILRISANGQLISNLDLNTDLRVTMGTPNGNLAVTTDNHFLITAIKKDSLNNSNISLAKTDLQGNVYWTKSYHVPYFKSHSMDVKETPDGNYILAGAIDTSYSGGNGNGADILLIKTDTAGNTIWKQEHMVGTGWTQNSKTIINTSDGGFIVTGRTDLGFGFDQSMFALKLDGLGNEQWHWISTDGDYTQSYGIYEDTDGSFVMTGYFNSNTTSTRELAIIRLAANGTLISSVMSGTGVAKPHGIKIYPSTMGSGYTIFGADDKGAFLMKVDSLGTAYSNTLTGRYFKDKNGNCVQDTNEYAFYGGLVNATNGVTNRYGSVWLGGKYSIDLDTGTYTVTAIPPSPYWQFCQNPQTVTFNGFYDEDSLDFAMEAVDSCAFLLVDVSTPILRRCFPTTYYVSYRNLGTIPAYNAYVDVTLDPYIRYDSSSAPLISQTGNTYRFAVDTVNLFRYNSFRVHVTVDCDSTVLGQTHCVEAHIFPDTLCSNTWSGPVIQTSSTCTNDSVIFTIQNIGANMSGAHDYSIIEEHVMIQYSSFQLNNGQSQDIIVPAAPGATYRIEADQAPGYPSVMGSPIAVSNYMGCNAPPTINFPNVLGQFYNGNTSPFVAVDCQENIGSYDPNDKRAQPLGYGNQHYIEENVALTYHIRFQNTGTDTAFRVEVVDTLDANLDFESIQMGASSHDYTWQLREGNILVVTFDNIMLPDSGANQLASNGFFKFEIDQKVNNPVGTMIYNSAGIYFDFNAPIITNETFHTIGKDFVAVLITGTEDILVEEAVEVKVYPNPFEQQTTLEVVGGDYEALQLSVYDITGRVVLNQSSTNNNIQIQRNNLPQGVYVYQLKGDGELINTGKLIVR